MREQYYVTLHSQMGPRTGVLTLQYQGENVTGSLYLLACHNFVRGVQTRDGKLHLFHSIQTAISSFPCETVLELQNGRLTGLPAARPPNPLGR